MTFDPAEFSDDTDFERFVLERLGARRIQILEPKYIHEEGNIVGILGVAMEGNKALTDLKESLRPLAFGAAYKVLDMLIEHVMRDNKVQNKRMSFSDKSRFLSQPAKRKLPFPLTSEMDLWDRLGILYVAFQEARYAVTHRRCQPTSVGDLTFFDNQRNCNDTLLIDEIVVFAALIT